MIRPKRMKRVTLFGPKSHMKKVIEELYELNVIHIEDFTQEGDTFNIGKPLEENEEYANVLVKIRSLISHLDIDQKDVPPRRTNLDAIENSVQKIYDKVNLLLEEKEFYNKLGNIYRKNKISESLVALKIEGDKAGLTHYIGYVNANLSDLREELENIKGSQVHTGRFEGINMVALFVPPKGTKQAEKLLSSYQYSPIDNPFIMEKFELASKPHKAFVKLEKEAETFDERIEDIDRELRTVKTENENFLREAEAKVEMEMEKTEAPLRFGTTKNTFLIQGWVPAKESRKLEKKIAKASNKSVSITLEDPGKHDDVPILFNHPKIVRPFEAFMDLYTLPSYREIDPTFFMFLTFPIFFGFMLGDVGYGLVTLGLFWFLKQRMPSARNFLNAFMIASVATIFFGLVFGEYFGVEELPHEMGQNLVESLPEGFVNTFNMMKLDTHGEEAEVVYYTPHLFQRSHQLEDLLSIAILFGIAHIFIGLIIGFINIYQTHGLKDAVFEKLGWIFMLPLIIWLLTNPLGVVSGYIEQMLSWINIVWAGPLFAIGGILTIIGEGMTGAIEVLFLALLSNILSYARLMAVGLASLSLAVVVNDLAGQMMGLGLVGIIPATLILVLGHGINIALGILSPFLHSLRLHYVEFFNKFYQGGGKKFESFGYNGGR